MGKGLNKFRARASWERRLRRDIFIFSFITQASLHLDVEVWFCKIQKTSNGKRMFDNASLPELGLSLTRFNLTPNDKISEWSKLKAFADLQIKGNPMIKSGLERQENIAEKGENDGY